jgi:hypothetical protein
VERSIAGIVDLVEALETGVPAMDQDKLSDDTCEDDHDEEDKMEEVVNEDTFNPPPHAPSHWQHCDDQRVQQELPRPPRQPNLQGMGGHPHHGPSQ